MPGGIMRSLIDDEDIPFGEPDEDQPGNEQPEETALVVPQPAQFDYSQLDPETAESLKAAANKITDILVKSATELGRIFTEVQAKLANHNKYQGIFENWYTSLRFKKQSVYNLIQRYTYVVQNLDNINLIESLPLSLSYEISKPSAPKELVDATLNGDIRTHKDYIEAQRLLREKDQIIAEKEKALEAERATNRRMDAVIHEKDEQLHSKNSIIGTLMAKPAEVKVEVKEVESPYLQKRVDNLQAEVMKLNNQVSAAHNELAAFEGLKHKKEEIENTYKKIEELKAQQSKVFKEMEETQAVFTFISKTKEFIKKEMLHIPSLVFMRDKPTNVLLDDLKGVITLLENFIAAMKDKFQIK